MCMLVWACGGACACPWAGACACAHACAAAPSAAAAASARGAAAAVFRRKLGTNSFAAALSFFSSFFPTSRARLVVPLLLPLHGLRRREAMRDERGGRCVRACGGQRGRGAEADGDAARTSLSSSLLGFWMPGGARALSARCESAAVTPCSAASSAILRTLAPPSLARALFPAEGRAPTRGGRRGRAPGGLFGRPLSRGQRSIDPLRPCRRPLPSAHAPRRGEGCLTTISPRSRGRGDPRAAPHRSSDPQCSAGLCTGSRRTSPSR